MTQISSFSTGKFAKDHAVSGYFDRLQAHATAGAQNAPSLQVEFTSDIQSKTHQALREAETSRRGKVSPSKTAPIRPSRGQTLHHVVKSLQEPRRGKSTQIEPPEVKVPGITCEIKWVVVIKG